VPFFKILESFKLFYFYKGFDSSFCEKLTVFSS
jgi:hypothetical protein